LTRFFAASLSPRFAMTTFSNIATEDITHEVAIGCHDLRNYQ
jgi:hypothetical protein